MRFDTQLRVVNHMSHLYDRLVIDAGEARVGRSDATVDDVVDLLETGKTPLQVTTALGVDAAELVAALAFAGLGGDDSLGLPLVQGEPPRPDLFDSLRESSIAILCPRVPKPVRLALSAGLLQVHDFWDESHTAAQEADDLGELGSSPYWHGVAHRREPDAGNAAYWFRRVGRHVIFNDIAEDAAPLIEKAGKPSWAVPLVIDGRWDPLAFVQACASIQSGTPDEVLARRLQRVEMLALLNYTLGEMNI